MPMELRRDSSSSTHISLNPFHHLSMLWTGANPESAASDEEALLNKYVFSPFKLMRVPVKLSSLGLGTQQINTLEINGDEKTSGVPIVWLHGAGVARTTRLQLRGWGVGGLLSSRRQSEREANLWAERPSAHEQVSASRPSTRCVVDETLENQT